MVADNGSAFGGFLGSLVGGATSMYNQHLAYKNSKKLTAYTAKTNYKYAKKTAENSPTWNRAGLENANYNPMLAVQNSTAGANSSWTSNASAPMADIPSGMYNATQALQAKAHLENETKTADSTKKLNDANAVKANSEAITNALKLPWIDKREKAEIANVEKNTSKLQSEINNIDKTTEYIDKYYTLEKQMQDIIKRGQDLSFAGFKYSADSSADAMKYSARKSAFANVYNSNTMADIAEKHSPSARSASFRNYAGGVADIVGAALHGTNNYYEGEEHTYDYDRNGNLSHEKHKGTKGKKGKRK